MQNAKKEPQRSQKSSELQSKQDLGEIIKARAAEKNSSDTDDSPEHQSSSKITTERKSINLYGGPTVKGRIQETQKKNSQLWLRNDSIVKVPKDLREQYSSEREQVHAIINKKKSEMDSKLTNRTNQIDGVTPRNEVEQEVYQIESPQNQDNVTQIPVNQDALKVNLEDQENPILEVENPNELELVVNNTQRHDPEEQGVVPIKEIKTVAETMNVTQNIGDQLETQPKSMESASQQKTQQIGSVVPINKDVPEKLLANNDSSLSSQSRNTYQVQAASDLHTIENKVKHQDMRAVKDRHPNSSADHNLQKRASNHLRTSQSCKISDQQDNQAVNDYIAQQTNQAQNDKKVRVNDKIGIKSDHTIKETITVTSSRGNQPTLLPQGIKIVSDNEQDLESQKSQGRQSSGRQQYDSDGPEKSYAAGTEVTFKGSVGHQQNNNNEIVVNENQSFHDSGTEVTYGHPTEIDQRSMCNVTTPMGQSKQILQQVPEYTDIQQTSVVAESNKNKLNRQIKSQDVSQQVIDIQQQSEINSKVSSKRVSQKQVITPSEEGQIQVSNGGEVVLKNQVQQCDTHDSREVSVQVSSGLEKRSSAGYQKQLNQDLNEAYLDNPNQIMEVTNDQEHIDIRIETPDNKQVHSNFANAVNMKSNGKISSRQMKPPVTMQNKTAQNFLVNSEPPVSHQNIQSSQSQVNKPYSVETSELVQYSSDAKINEQELISSKLPTQNDYMADQSREGSQTDCRSFTKGHETFYIQIYQKEGTVNGSQQYDTSKRESSSIQDQNLNEHSSFEKQGFLESQPEAPDKSKNSVPSQVLEETEEQQEELLENPSNVTQENLDVSKKSLNKNKTTSKIVSKTQQDVSTNWREMDIEKIHEMGSADEQSRLVSSRVPEQNIQPEDSVNQLKDIDNIGHSAYVDSPIQKKSSKQIKNENIKKVFDDPPYNSSRFREDSLQEERVILCSTERPVFSIEANIDAKYSHFVNLSQSVDTYRGIKMDTQDSLLKDTTGRTYGDNNMEYDDPLLQDLSQMDSIVSQRQHEAQQSHQNQSYQKTNEQHLQDHYLAQFKSADYQKGQLARFPGPKGAKTTKRNVPPQQLISFENQARGLIDINDEEFIRKYKMMRESHRERFYQPQGQHALSRPELTFRAEENFDLKSFLRDNDLEGVVGKIEGQSEISSRRGYQKSHFNQYSNRESSLNHSIDYTGFSNIKDPKESFLQQNSPRRLKSRLNLVQKAIDEGLISVEQIFMLLQFIMRAHGEPVYSDNTIFQIVMPYRNLVERSDKVHQFKYQHIIKFMTKNPHIMVQVLQLYGINENGQISTHRQNNGFFDKRPKYTQKILQQLKGNLPGLIGHMPQFDANQLNQSVTIQPDHQKFNLNYQEIYSQNLRDPDESRYSKKGKQHKATSKFLKDYYKQGLKSNNYSTLDRKHVGSSFSPHTLRNLSHARKAASRVHQSIKDQNVSFGTGPNSSSVNPPSNQRSLETREKPHIPLISKMYSVKLKEEFPQNNLLKKKNGNGRPTTDANSRELYNRKQSPPYETSNVLSSYDNVTSFGLPQLKDNLKGQQIPKSQHMVTRLPAQRNPENIHQGLPGSMSGNVNSKDQQDMALTTFDGKDIYQLANMKKPQTHHRAIRQKFGNPKLINNVSSSMEGKHHIAGFGGFYDQLSNAQKEPSMMKHSQPISETNTNTYNLRNDELSNHRKSLEQEERDLSRHRKDVIKEKEKLNKQLKRLNQKKELKEKEDKVKNQRKILEIEKKKLREDMQELDQLKDKLASRKNELGEVASTTKGSQSNILPNDPMKDVPINLIIEEGQIFSDENQIDSNGDLVTKAKLKHVDSSGATPKPPSRENSVKDKQKQFPRKVVSPTQYSKGTIESNTSGFFDWASSQIMEDVVNNRENFGLVQPTNSVDVKNYLFTEEEIYALIEELKVSQKNLNDPVRLKFVYNKALDTLRELMSNLNQTQLFQMIAQKYSDLSIDNTVKLLVRCKQQIVVRKMVYFTLQGIQTFEKDTAEIRKAVDEFLEGDRDDLKQKVWKLAKDNLPILTQKIIDNINSLRDQHKLFSKMGATTSKGNQVHNLMTYKRRDAMRYLTREYEAIKRLVLVVDVQVPALKLKH